MAAASLNLDNSYARELQGFSVPWRPQAVPAPKSLFFNHGLAHELGPVAHGQPKHANVKVE